MIIFFDWEAEIDRPRDKNFREELDVFDPSDLESWNEIEKKKFAEIRMLCYLKPSHTNTHTTVGPQQKRK